MRFRLGSLVMIALSMSACASEPIDADEGMGAAGSGGSAGGAGKGNGGAPAANPCSGALKQELSLVDEVSTASVSVLSQNGSELVVYVDATAGGIDGQDQNPWVYISLASGAAVPVGDLDALMSLDWDLALKRFVIRTNSGDSGPGQGGAIRVMLSWDDVDASTLGTRRVAVEDWFDEDCSLTIDAATGDVITTFSGWSEYDEATHVLAPADAVYLTQGADGTLYKVAILDYYSTPTGTSGTTPGRYRLRVAPLP
ncbi:MAG TPA: HmuY family protein [Polyangiaceae bacterium]|nr:HmuY family protein [Polyangiaceae bacterium]